MITIFFMCTSVCIAAVHYRYIKQVRLLHKREIIAQSRTLEHHLIQISVRKKQLGLYDLKKYNLSEALVPQHNIIL